MKKIKPDDHTAGLIPFRTVKNKKNNNNNNNSIQGKIISIPLPLAKKQFIQKKSTHLFS